MKKIRDLISFRKRQREAEKKEITDLEHLIGREKSLLVAQKHMGKMALEEVDLSLFYRNSFNPLLAEQVEQELSLLPTKKQRLKQLKEKYKHER